MVSLEEYLEDCKRHLVDFKTETITQTVNGNIVSTIYKYHWDIIVECKNYFDKCRMKGLNAYNALLFFDDYLDSL